MFGFWKKKTPQPALSDEQKKLLRVQLKLFRDTAQDWRAKKYDLRRADHQAEVWASLASAVAAFRETTGYQAFVNGSRMQELFTYSTTNPREFSARLGDLLRDVRAASSEDDASELLLGNCYYLGER